MPTRIFLPWEVENLVTLMKKNEADHAKDYLSPYDDGTTPIPKHVVNYFKPFFKPMPTNAPCSMYINIPLYKQCPGKLAKGNIFNRT